MPTTSRNKPARTENQMFPLVESWLRSNLTQKEFSAQQGLSPHVLPYWINRYRQQAQPAPVVTNQEAIPTQALTSFIRLNSPLTNTAPVDTP